MSVIYTRISALSTTSRSLQLASCTGHIKSLDTKYGLHAGVQSVYSTELLEGLKQVRWVNPAPCVCTSLFYIHIVWLAGMYDRHIRHYSCHTTDRVQVVYCFDSMEERSGFNRLSTYVLIVDCRLLTLVNIIILKT